MLARTREAVPDFAEDIASGVVMKIVSPEIIHKSDTNGG
jgi:acyl-CoA synthetase (NDP forming)